MNLTIRETGALAGVNQAVTAEVRHLQNAAVGVQVAGTFSATVLIEATMNGTNWDAYAFINCASGATGTSITAPGQFRTELVGVQCVRARMSERVSGTATVTVVVKGN